MTEMPSDARRTRAGASAVSLAATEPEALAELLFPGGGELGALVRAMDWGTTPLGPMASWPSSLRTAVSIVLYSDFPMIVLWGASLVQIYNDAYRLLMGTKHPEGLGQGNRECWPEAWHINATIYPRILAGETIAFRESRYPLAPHGVVEDFYLTLSYSPVREERGDVAGVFVTVFDVTTEVRARLERDSALAQARAGRERLYEVFQQAPAAIAVLEGPDFTFTVANPRYRELVGGRDVVGRTLHDALPEVREQGFLALLERVRRTREPFVATDAIVRLDRSGTGALEDVYLDFVYQPLLDGAGTVYGVMAHAVETTVRRQLQHEVELQRNRLAEVFQQAPALIAVTEGPTHVFSTANPFFRRVVGARRSLEGLPVREALPDLEGQGFFELLDGVFTTGEPFLGNEILARFDREGDGVMVDVFFNFVYQPVRAASGAVRGIMIHAVEVTEQVLARRDAEEKAEELARVAYALEASNRELDQFAYVASHDLKAPLRGIGNLAQWIAEDLGDRLTVESTEHMRLLQGRVHRMEALIDGILTYSRAGRVRAEPEVVATLELVRDVIDLQAAGPGVTIDVPPDLPTLETERVPLQQVFMNLIGNAVKYTRSTRPDVHVRLAWRPARDGFQFSVSDNGPGIAPQYHERVWGIFQTLQARDKVEGTGIGLSVVKKIVESRGGRAWIDSVPGDGATFHFTWPRVARINLDSVEPTL